MAIHQMISYFRRFWHHTWASWLLRLAFAVFLLALLFSQVDFGGALHILSRIDTQLLIPAFILFIAVRFIWAYLRSLCLRPLHLNFTVLQLFKIILIATFYSVILPGGIVTGSAAAWYKLSKPEHKNVEAGALLVFIRLIEMLTLLAIGLIGVWFDPHLNSLYFRAVVGVMFLGVVVLILPFVSPKASQAFERRFAPVFHRLPASRRVREKSRRGWRTLTAFQALGKGTIAVTLGLSVFSHLIGVLVFVLLAQAVDIRLSVFAIGWLRTLLSIIQMMPVSIAGLGVREISLVMLLGDYGIPKAQALSWSLAVFGLTAVVAAAGGLLEAWDLLMEGRKSDSPLNKGSKKLRPKASHSKPNR